MSIPTRLKDIFIFGLFMALMYLFFFGDIYVANKINFEMPDQIKTIFVFFLGIFLEALPFLLLGAIASSIINLYISEETIARIMPKNPFIAIIVALIAALITPVCECAIIPVVRRLIQKGIPVHIGVVLLMGAPILNFIVFGSTYYAFQNNISIAYGRFIICVLASIIVSFIIYMLFSKQKVLKTHREDLMSSVPVNENKGDSKWKGILHHTCHEFFTIGKYFIIGAVFASVAQVYLKDSYIMQAGESSIEGTAVMMGLAYVLSLCSEADAFVAASFSRTFTPEAIIGFLVFGPILDFKNTFVMMASFRIKFVLLFILIVTIVVYILSVLSGFFLSPS
ncbi:MULTISPECIES: permease [unclassified Bacillus (in: firmicutes)]|uniref:permease n=1 Tax=unclassified Bacillus (in: firmicutes) TaxID=185979 RepID=UPI0004E108EA|nr:MULTISPECIES: permease [unclassified Bacillus (in: firmicutes)]